MQFSGSNMLAFTFQIIDTRQSSKSSFVARTFLSACSDAVFRKRRKESPRYQDYIFQKKVFRSLILLCSICAVLNTFVANAQETFNLSPGKKITLTDAAFTAGSATLETSQKQVFVRLVEFLAKRDRLNIEIGGHADNQGNEAQNNALSLARAESVRAFLVEHGIAASRIRTRGYGSQFPIADNASLEGRTKNRRVEIIGLSALTGRLLVSPDGKPLSPEARITAIKPSVSVMSAWEGEWREATMNEELYEAFRVQSGENAWLDITFRNNSTMHLSQNATMYVYGFEAASRLQLGALSNGQNSPDAVKNIELEKGDLMLKLKEMKAQDTFSVRTKNSRIGFNTASVNVAAKVRVDAKERSIISVLQGRANVQVLANDPRTGQILDVKADFGVIVGGNGDESQGIMPLPKPPELQEPEERIAPSAEPTLFRWKNAGYASRLEVSSNAEFTEFVHNTISKTGETKVLLPEGTYFVRLTNIDSIGFESQPFIRALVVSSNVPSTPSQTPFHFRALEFICLVAGGASIWASILFKNIRLRYIGIACVVASLLMFLLL
jgi:outer membrane protein OmpA-like peptidoglycan-associated protein